MVVLVLVVGGGCVVVEAVVNVGHDERTSVGFIEEVGDAVNEVGEGLEGERL